ncbi:MAG: hypothetical protein FWH26_05380 [Oscillospiraceae bacterium]|nr:hypothetical protein [Oscillospiraceae bacterium]
MHDIKTSWDKVNPDAAAEHRMLNEAMSRARAAGKGGNLMLTRKKYFRTALIAAALVCVLAVSVFAAVKLLTPVEVAEWLDPEIAKAFRSSEAMLINEAQTTGDYEITLLGIAPAQNFSRLMVIADGKPITHDADRVFAVFAVRRTDGTALPADLQGIPRFHAWPLIEGVDPAKHAFESGGGIGSVQNGVMYYLIDCFELYPFADRQVFISVAEASDRMIEPYSFDEVTGKFVPNPAHKGLRALFELPLDQSRADPARAAELLKQAAANS